MTKTSVVTVHHRKTPGTDVSGMWDYDAVVTFTFTDKPFPLDTAWFWTQDFGVLPWYKKGREGMNVLVSGYCRPTRHGDLMEMDGQYYLVSSKEDFEKTTPVTVTTGSRTRG